MNHNAATDKDDMSVTGKETAGTIGARMDALEARAWLDLYKAAPPASVQALELNHHHQPYGVGLAMRRIPSPLFNRFLVAGPASISESSLSQAAAWIKQNAATTQAIDIHSDGDSRTAASLRALGLQASGSETAQFHRAMSSPLAPPVCELTIQAVGADKAEEFGDTLRVGYGLPPAFSQWLAALPGRPDWHTYIAYSEARPVAVAALYIQGELGWLGVAATLPEYRGRGAQNALLARRLNDGFALGARLFTVQTGSPAPGDQPGPSFRNIQRAGFTLSHTRKFFTPAQG